MKKTFITETEKETQKVAQDLIKSIFKKKAKKSLVFALFGDLGSGKTIFVKGLAKGLGIKKRITSPTFVIMREYRVFPKTYNLKPRTFLHIDCYRVGEEDILDLGWPDLIKGPQNIVAIEWADRIKKILPKDSVRIRFRVIGKEKRKIVIKS